MARPPAPSPTSRGPRAVDLLDEAVSLLRRTPLPLFFIYYLGAGPFCLGIIYFVFDMTENARAEDHLVPFALGLALLYVWMKTCQAVFARRLLERLEGGTPEPWTLLRWLNTALLQAAFGGSQLIVYPAAIVIGLPFAWVNAFYHSISIVATDRRGTLRQSLVDASKLAILWPRQNWFIVGIQFIAVFILFLNMGAMLALIPGLLDMFLGISTVFDESRSAWVNSSFYLEVSLLCFLVMNPVSKAVYVLRCFYGRARLDGADLRAELRFHQAGRERSTPVRAVALLALVFAFVTAFPTHADDTNAAPAPVLAPTPPRALLPVPAADVTPPASSANLNQAIEKTLQKDEFAWRLPHAAAAPDENSFFARLLRSITHFRDWLYHKIEKVMEKLFDWIFGKDRDHSNSSSLSKLAAIPWRGIFIVLAILVVVVLVVLILRHFRPQLPVRDSTSTAPVQAVDLEAEDIRADQLPEDSWLALAQELIGRGELRLALRALYLATLSILAHSELIRLGPAKSNRDYLNEMTRRLRENGAAVPVFRDSIRLFEASWYGTHDVTGEVLGQMQANHQIVRGHVAA